MNQGIFGFPEGGKWLWRSFRGVIHSGAVTSNVNAQALIVDGDSPNIDLALTPKGTGAFLAQTPDGTIKGGNSRGPNAVDLQTERTVATQVASGTGSFAAGSVNTASGTYSFAAGRLNTASGTGSRAGGQSATTRSIEGADAFASGFFAVLGDAQYATYCLRVTTTDATPVVMRSNTSAAGTTNQVVLPNDATYAFEALIVARRTDADNESAGYKITGVIDRNANAASTLLVGTPVVTILAEDMAAWDVAVSADTTNGALAFTVTGEAAKTIRFVASVKTVEVSG